MKPGKWNTPLITVGGALVGAAAASYQATGQWVSSPDAVVPHIGYIVIVGAAFGIICGVASAALNRSLK